MTEEQAKALKLGDKLRLVNLPEFSRRHEGEIITVTRVYRWRYHDEGPLELGIEFEEEKCFKICLARYCELCRPDEPHTCVCDVVKLMAYGCKCGGM